MNPIMKARRLARDGVLRAPRMMARDGANPLSANILSRGQQRSQFGWIAPVLSKMGSSSRWVMSLNSDNQVVVGNSYPLEGVWTTPNALYNACALAVQGQAGKTQASAAWPSTPAAQTLTLTANTVSAFGAYIRISNSVTNFGFGTYEIQLMNGGTILAYFTVIVMTLPVELVVLSISLNRGKTNVIPDAAPAVLFPYSATPGAVGNINAGSFKTGDLLYAETLNMADIGNVVGAMNRGAILL